MTIREYASTVRQRFLSTDQPPSDYHWREAFEHRGYVGVLLGQQGHREWQEVHQWCCCQFGEQNYVWTGSRFWFSNDQDAALFALRWA